MAFDPDGPAPQESGIFGLDTGPEQSACIVIPAPYQATVSYREGTAGGPEAILRASRQVDLLDLDAGAVYEPGIHMEPASEDIVRLSAGARPAAVRAIDALTHGVAPSAHDIAVVDRAGERVNAIIRERFEAVLARGKLPVLVGGDHSTALGSILACAALAPDEPLGVLQVDAHADLREAYEGFRTSHASVMWNALRAAPNVHLFQVGIRDLCGAELDEIRGSDRIHTWFDRGLRTERLAGRFANAAAAIAAALPGRVYISFDIDGLEPALCPSTGTPVPGGLSFDEAVCLLEAVAQSGARVVGMDLNEVSPGAAAPDEDAWDAVVGARVLYKMIGFALATRGHACCRAPQLPVPRTGRGRP